MGRYDANLMINAIENDRIDISMLHCVNDRNKEALIENLRTFPVKTLNRIKKQLRSYNIEELCPEYFSRYLSFYVIGCPDSTDIDVIIVIDKIYLMNGIPLPLYSSENQRLLSELSELGYDISRSIDYNIIIIENGYIIGQTKGGIDTSNIIIRTHHLHAQKYVYDLNLVFIQSEIINRIKSIAKFILDYLENVAIDYHSIRSEKNDIYAQGNDKRIEYSLTILDKIYLNTSSLDEVHAKGWHDFMKSVTMKIIQLALQFYHSDYEFIKENLAQLSARFDFNPENTRWFLFRGKRGEFSDRFIPQLFELYNTIVLQYNSNQHVINVSFPKTILTNNTQLSETLFAEFIASPTKPSEKFQQEFTINYPDCEINTLFPIAINNIDELTLPSQIKSQIIQVPQRSDEWIWMLSEFYQCGKNSGTIKNTIEGKYNLLRGSITESLILEYFQPSMIGLSTDWQKIQVGLLVEEVNQKGSRGCSPDLLLVRENQIIPVEIKTLHCSNKNNDYYRGLELAKKQCHSVRDILDSTNKYNLFSQYLIILGYYSTTDLILECHLFNFE
jgi:hypothetical protein